MAEPKIVNAKIATLTDKGNGVGTAIRDNGESYPVEVPFAIPGDEVEVALLRKRKGRWMGRLEQVVAPSEDRIQPRCIHFGACGGCRFQQMEYEKQLEYKENYVRKVFADMLSNCDFKPIIPCKNHWRYRNKMEFSFSSDSHGKKYLGLFLDSQKGRVLDLKECHLVDTWFMDGLKAARQWWHESRLEAYHPPKDAGSLRTITFREGERTGDRMIMLTVSGNPDFAMKSHELESFVAFMRDAVEPVDPSRKLSIFLRIHQMAKGMATNFYEMHLYGSEYLREVIKIQPDANGPSISLNFNVGPSSFFQPNTSQAEIFYSKAIQLAKIPEGGIVYDLYCGTGTLGICAAQRAKQVVGIELFPDAALDARTNVTNNDLKNVTIMSGAVRHILKQIQDENLFPAPDVVMIDPPRPGLDPEAMRHLLTLKASRIVYLSCNPATQARDVAELLQNGYKLETIQPIDQFPQTYHIENIVILSR